MYLPFLVVSECSQLPRYGIGNNYGSSFEIYKPAFVDTVARIQYLHASIIDNSAQIRRSGESSNAISLGYGRARTSRYFTLGWSAQVYRGEQQVKAIAPYSRWYSFAGGSVSVDLALSFKVKKFNVRPVCFSYGIGIEKGSFDRFRKQAAKEEILINANPTGEFGHFSMGPELMFNHKNFSASCSARILFTNRYPDIAYGLRLRFKQYLLFTQTMNNGRGMLHRTQPLAIGMGLSF